MSRLLLANLVVWSCLVGAGVGAVQTMRAPEDGAALPRPEPGQGEREVALLSLDLPARDAFEAVTARPLFSETRRPPERREVARRPADLPPLALTGVTGRPGALEAIVVHPDDGVLRLGQGGRVADWIVSDITLVEIELSPADGGGAVRIALGETAAEGETDAAPDTYDRETGVPADPFSGPGYD